MITAEQRELRRSRCGSSDAPAICGVDPYRSASDVWLEKTGQVEDFVGNQNTDRGNLLEPVLLTWAERRLGRPLVRDQMFVEAGGLLCVNFDALVDGEPASIEAKTATDATEWGEEGTDQVPDRHIVQAHLGFAVRKDLRICWVPVLLPGYRSLDFRLYRIDRNEGLAEAVAEKCGHFMAHNVRLGYRPDDFKPSLEVLKRMRREPGKVAVVKDETADAWIVARAARLQAEKDEEAAKTALLVELSDADAGDYSGGRITYLPQTRRGIDADALRTRYPDAAKACERVTTYRTLRTELSLGSAKVG